MAKENNVYKNAVGLVNEYTMDGFEDAIREQMDLMGDMEALLFKEYVGSSHTQAAVMAYLTSSHAK